MKLLITYLILINALGICFMLADKIKARKNRWRIPEATLIGIALFGGSLGVIIGMRLFRHKTLHPKFSIGVPLVFALQLIAGILIRAL
ncbi:MAG: DUF1294 domain-containing protein [Oscillospiraceae bacterium]|nr:DUF1294 domain-containing protein [Oscillospiraceae bacterium]